MQPREVAQKFLGPDRNLRYAMDTFRGARFAAHASGILSGGTVSGGGLTLYQVSSQVTVRLLNVEVWNREAGWIEVEFRDGGFAGGRVLGPMKVNPRDRLELSTEQVLGRTFTSSIYVMVLSGYAAQPLSNGVLVNAGFVLEPSGDFFE